MSQLNTLKDTAEATALDLSPSDPEASIFKKIRLYCSPSPGAYNYPIFLSPGFHRPIYFLNLKLSRIQIPTETSVTNCNQAAVALAYFTAHGPTR